MVLFTVKVAFNFKEISLASSILFCDITGIFTNVKGDLKNREFIDGL